MNKLGFFLFCAFLITSVIFGFIVFEKSFVSNYFNLSIIGFYLSILSLGVIPKITKTWSRIAWLLLLLGCIIGFIFLASPSAISFLWKPAISLVLIQFAVAFFQFTINKNKENNFTIRKYLFFAASLISIIFLFRFYHPILSISYIICMIGMILLPFFKSKKLS